MADIIKLRKEPLWWMCRCGCNLFRIAPGCVVVCSECGKEQKGWEIGY